MAELVDILTTFSLHESVCTDCFSSSGAPNARRLFWQRMLPLLFFTTGKIADIAIDWIVVARSYNGSVAIDAPAIRVAAVVIAVLGTFVEACALVLKLIVCLRPGLIGLIRRGSATCKLREVKLNRSLAIPRFVLDDFPATVLGIVILATAHAELPDVNVMLANGTALSVDRDIANVTRCTTSETTVSFVDGSTTLIKEAEECELTEVTEVSAASDLLFSWEFWLIVISVMYSIFYMIYYYFLRPTSGIAAELENVLKELRAEGHSASDLKAAGCKASKLKAAGFPLSELKAARFTAKVLKEAEFTCSELTQAGFTWSELMPVYEELVILRAIGHSASDLKAAGCKASKLKAAGFPLSELKAARFTAKVLKEAEEEAAAAAEEEAATAAAEASAAAAAAVAAAAAAEATLAAAKARRASAAAARARAAAD
eukprot:CAMPEP_0185463922 /NCGR_PEP_ID=MMETSP1365-20130426/95473_1 /TAXON_ID=38817 /ORGANISM="Gephyrocapsa oceanica, Strain RCC1303" /LENGTH=429 /DNA_ID=CAMNT_0028070661 /DNA_START=82 /DNA_END=1371 /DNA_ORIENTATION=+